jgi:hypothetical protein
VIAQRLALVQRRQAARRGCSQLGPTVSRALLHADPVRIEAQGLLGLGLAWQGRLEEGLGPMAPCWTR